jgi:large subunit ribosomal protein L31
MQTDIQPQFIDCKVTCLACGNEFKTKATQSELRTELCSNCHPFYTGKQVLVDTAGQVDRFKRRMEVAGSHKEKAAKKKAVAKPVEKTEEKRELSNEELLKKVRDQLAADEKKKKTAKAKPAESAEAGEA